MRVSLPLSELTIPRILTAPTIANIKADEETGALERLSSAALHQRLLESFAPPSVVVSESYDIVHLSPEAGKYLEITGGEPSHNLLKMIRPELRLELRTALYQAVSQKKSVETSGLPISIGEQAQIIKLVVRPILQSSGEGTRGFLLVLFEESADAAEGETRTTAEIMRLDEPARQLEAENEQLRNHLRSTIDQYETQTEELRASNEELQAMNEELRSATEELETGKEELQSINEELQTVNQELKIKIEELSQSNNDFLNLMSSTDVGTLFLDRRLRIKLFTPHTLDIFNLRPTDVGRPLSDITTKLEYETLLADTEFVIAHLQSVTREVMTTDKRDYTMTILPYRTTEDRIDGIIITFVEITQSKRYEKQILQLVSQLKQQTEIFDTTLSSISDFAYMFDADGRFVFANQPLLDLLGVTLAQIKGKNFDDLNYPANLATRLQKQIRQVFDTKKSIRDETPFTNPKTDIEGFYEYIFTPFFAADKTVKFVVGSTRDVTTRIQNEKSLRESEERLRLLVESATDFAIFRVTAEGLIASWNVGAEKVFGWTESEIVGQSSEILFTPEDRAQGVPQWEMKTALEKGRAPDERWHIRQDRTRFYVSGVMMRLREGAEGFVKIARDQTNKIETEKNVREKEMLQKLVGALENERRRIARNLHDELGNKLTALRLKLEAVRNICADNDEICGGIEDSQNLVRQIDRDVDFLAWELRPAALDDLGLTAAVEKYVREWSQHSGVTVELHTTGLKRTRLMSEIETNLYRITQEALNNTHKYAQATHVSVLLEKRGDSVILIIEDDGKGFDLKSKKIRNTGIGLIGMQERAALVGGSLEIESAPKKGTTIFVRVPAIFVKKEKGK